MFDEMSKKHSFGCSTTLSAKRQRFNPEVVAAKTRKRLQLQQRLTESYQALLSAAVDIVESPHAHDVLSRASNQEKNVCCSPTSVQKDLIACEQQPNLCHRHSKNDEQAI